MVLSTSFPMAKSSQRSVDKKAWGVWFSDQRIRQRKAGKEGKSTQEVPGRANKKCLEEHTGSAWNRKQEMPGRPHRKCLEQKTRNAWKTTQEVPGMARLGRRRKLSLDIPCSSFVL